jgi:hypothetical protein
MGFFSGDLHRLCSSFRALTATVKARWTCKQVHQQLKEELGLDHFEDRLGPDYTDMP